MDKKTFCPFINGNCTDKCVFSTHNIACSNGITNCLIVSKLDSINDYQYELLTDIISLLKKEN